jgi:hypothetical protein
VRLFRHFSQRRKALDAHTLLAVVSVVGRQFAALRRARVTEDLAAVATVMLAARQCEHGLTRLTRSGGGVGQPLGTLLKEKRFEVIVRHFHKSTSHVLGRPAAAARCISMVAIVPLNSFDSIMVGMAEPPTALAGAIPAG